MEEEKGPAESVMMGELTAGFVFMPVTAVTLEVARVEDGISVMDLGFETWLMVPTTEFSSTPRYFLELESSRRLLSYLKLPYLSFLP